MYYAIVILLMAVFPIITTVWDRSTGAHWRDAASRWFAFWPVGVRLLLAGLRQVLKPDFTAKSLFGIIDPAVLSVVRDLGFGNLALAVPALLVPWQGGRIVPTALAGGFFLVWRGWGIWGPMARIHNGWWQWSAISR